MGPLELVSLSVYMCVSLCVTFFSNTRAAQKSGPCHLSLLLSSPRAKRAGPKGLRAESARAVTGRRCPHSGVGEDFLARRPVFFTKRAVSQKPKVEKSIQRCQIDRLAEVYKWVIDKIQGPIAKTGFWGQNPNFWAQKKGLTS